MSLSLFILFVLTNMERASTTQLQYDVELATLAQTRAGYLCTNNQWSHDGWLDSFKDMPDTLVGENLVKYEHYPYESEYARGIIIQNSLNDSPKHYKNITDSQYKKIGIGEACDITVFLFTNKEV